MRDRGRGAPLDRVSVNPAVEEDLQGIAHADGIESLRSTLETGYRGAIHRLNRGNHGRGDAELVDPQKLRERVTVAQMWTRSRDMVGGTQIEEVTCESNRLGGNQMGYKCGGDGRSEN